MGRIAYSLRFATFQRQHHFTNAELTRDAISDILRTCSEEDFVLIAYCFMPDHVHLAVKGQKEHSDLRRFVKIAKQRVAYRARTRFGIALIWQDGYYERIVRSHGMESVVRYILNNPVKAGLAARAEDYPFSGVSREWDARADKARPDKARGTFSGAI